MHSIAVLGAGMAAHAFGAHIPGWRSPVATIGITGDSLWRSILILKRHKHPPTREELKKICPPDGHAGTGDLQ
jgi:hypothetical protein